MNASFALARAQAVARGALFLSEPFGAAFKRFLAQSLETGRRAHGKHPAK